MPSSAGTDGVLLQELDEDGESVSGKRPVMLGTDLGFLRVGDDVGVDGDPRPVIYVSSDSGAPVLISSLFRHTDSCSLTDVFIEWAAA
jgi:hypothetical protein